MYRRESVYQILGRVYLDQKQTSKKILLLEQLVARLSIGKKVD
jgi:hypothetical protein